MKLNNCEILPGTVVCAEDPKKMGRIKAVVPGWFDNSSMNEEDMYWINPFSSGGGYQRVSKPLEGQKVWVLHDTTNEYEYYWIPMFETNINTTAAQQDFDYDVLVSRSGKGVGSQQFYTGQQGFVTRIGKNTMTNMTQGGDIINSSFGVEMSMKGGKAYVGQEGKCDQPMVLGNVLYELLGELKKGLNNLYQLAQSNAYCTNLCPGINECIKAISDNMDKMNSKTSFVSE